MSTPNEANEKSRRLMNSEYAFQWEETSLVDTHRVLPQYPCPGSKVNCLDASSAFSFIMGCAGGEPFCECNGDYKVDKSNNPQQGVSCWTDLTVGLCLRGTQRVLMLFAYFDESYVDDPDTGRRSDVIVGGCIASVDNWKEFNREWSAVLASECLTMFHMKDFEYYKEEFRGWTVDRHRTVLNDLLSIYVNHVQVSFGITTSVHHIRGRRKKPRSTLRSSYLNSARRAIEMTISGADVLNKQQLNVVFAKHPEVASSYLEKIAADLKTEYPNLLSVEGGTPQVIIPLQASDLIAYEIAHWNSLLPLDQWRYPMRFLHLKRHTVFKV